MLCKFLELCKAGAARRGDHPLGIVDGLDVVVTIAAVPGAQPAQVVICFLVTLEKPLLVSGDTGLTVPVNRWRQRSRRRRKKLFLELKGYGIFSLEVDTSFCCYFLNYACSVPLLSILL